MPVSHLRNRGQNGTSIWQGDWGVRVSLCMKCFEWRHSSVNYYFSKLQFQLRIQHLKITSKTSYKILGTAHKAFHNQPALSFSSLLPCPFLCITCCHECTADLPTTGCPSRPLCLYGAVPSAWTTHPQPLVLQGVFLFFVTGPLNFTPVLSSSGPPQFSSGLPQLPPNMSHLLPDSYFQVTIQCHTNESSWQIWSCSFRT